MALITILDSITEIVRAAKGCGLDEDFIKWGPVCGRIEALSERLDISPCQSVLLALLVERSAYEALSLHDMAEYFGIQTVQMLQKLDALEDLEAHGYLSSQMVDGKMTFRVPWQVLHSFAYDMVYSPKEGMPQETERVIVTLFSLFNYYLAADTPTVPVEEFRVRIVSILDGTDLPMFLWLRDEVPSEWPLFGILLYLLCCEYFRRWEYCTGEYLVKLVSDNPREDDYAVLNNLAANSDYIQTKDGDYRADGTLWYRTARLLEL